MKLKQKKGWADRRFDRKSLRGRPNNPNAEYLVGCGFIREGELHGYGMNYRSHAEIRLALGDEHPYRENHNDDSGFFTSTGRFVGRVEGSTIAAIAGEAAPMYDGKRIMSSDITWRKS